MKQKENTHVILYDGWCNLCSASVRFVIQNDRAGSFRFASLQSEAGKALLGDRFPLKQVPDSIVYVEGKNVFVRSEAVLRILKKLGRGWQFFYFLHIMPSSLRDGLYDFIARTRHRVFGRRSACHLLPPGREYKP